MNARKQNQAIQNVQRIQKLERELAKETAKVADLKDALRNLLAWTDGQEHLHGLTDSGKQKYRADVQHAKEVLK